MSDIGELKEQMVELQSQMAFQENNLESLNDAFAIQQQEILTLRRQLELLKQTQEEQAADMEQAPLGSASEKPPHY